MTITDLKPEERTLEMVGRLWALGGFNIVLERKILQIFVQVYLPSTLFVIASWVSFIVDPKIVPGRMGLIVITFLALINIFIGEQRMAPKSSGLNAADVFLVVCFGEVFATFLEYSLVLYGFGERQTAIVFPIMNSNQFSISENSRNQDQCALDVKLENGKNWWKTIFQKTSRIECDRNVLDRISLYLFPISFLTFLAIYLYQYIY